MFIYSHFSFLSRVKFKKIGVNCSNLVFSHKK